MNWKDLLCKERFNKTYIDPSYDPRSPYQRDIDRILFSSPFRRMQDKTQVFPIPKSDFIHNRLTHSIEVSSVGRSLGLLAGQFVLETKEPALVRTELSSREGFVLDDFANIVAAACLAHDIGNPPFGHSGEKAIGAFFKNEGKEYTTALIDEEGKDLKTFEGNAAGFRILTRTPGLELTYASIGAFTKYPWSSSSIDEEYVIEDKYGFFYSDRENFESVATKLGLKYRGTAENRVWCRHPLSFLMEAADTICYRVIDVEDSVKLRLLDYKTAVSHLEAICRLTPIVEDRFKPEMAKKINETEYLAYLRAKAISSLIYQAIEVWKEKYDEIMNGRFNKELLDICPSNAELENIKQNLIKRAFNHPLVLKIELAGFEVLGGLLREFCGAAFDKFEKTKNRKLFALIPEQFLTAEGKWHADSAEKLLQVTDFVSRMTDSYAIDLYRSLKGINLAIIE
ncbi:dGTP triphosphohydrolase [Mucilaginibacter endophyticus]|uniref:dGTP triphosphohydrolase n=1 Tax=Mucilaginibacter endophyticus TaxID=2675003 RepID=UPI000E0DDF9F|nr:dNTP triphosphohydrolase [Mucilaginibacter endophyticus]